MTDVFVANDQIADVQIKSTNQLYVFGKAGGETTVYASNAAGDVVWSANVRVGTNIDSIDQMLKLAMPEAHIVTSTMNNTVLLTGTIAAPEDAAEAERLVKAFVDPKTTVISRLKMATPLQVNLHVKFAEVNRSLVRQIGSNLTTIDGNGNVTKFGLNTGRSAGSTFTTDPTLPLGIGTSVQGYGFDPTAITPTNPQGLVLKPGTNISPLQGQLTLAVMGKMFGLNVLSALDLGETIGLVTSLAEPNLTALSGETANFLAGGEYPIPISTGLGNTGDRVQALRYLPRLHADGARQRAHLAAGAAGSVRAFLGRRDHQQQLQGVCAHRAQRRNDDRTRLGPELHDRWPPAQWIAGHDHQDARRGRHPDPGFAVPLDLVPEGRDRAGDHRHPLSGEPGRFERDQAADRWLQIGDGFAAGARPSRIRWRHRRRPPQADGKDRHRAIERPQDRRARCAASDAPGFDATPAATAAVAAPAAPAAAPKKSARPARNRQAAVDAAPGFNLQ
jgi:pilus assembly protein CpaC